MKDLENSPFLHILMPHSRGRFACLKEWESGSLGAKKIGFGLFDLFDLFDLFILLI